VADFFKKSLTVLSRALTVLAIMVVFAVGLVGTMLIFLSGSEVSVPEIVGKSYAESEDMLSDLGLRIKRRAERYSEEPEGTILEQIPRAGETVKTGQMILVVVSKSVPDGDERPATIQKGADKEEDDSGKIEELILDRPVPSPTATPTPKVEEVRQSEAEKSELEGAPTPSPSPVLVPVTPTPPAEIPRSRIVTPGATPERRNDF
jgi:hypothetical protein